MWTNGTQELCHSSINIRAHSDVAQSCKSSVCGLPGVTHDAVIVPVTTRNPVKVGWEGIDHLCCKPLKASITMMVVASIRSSLHVRSGESAPAVCSRQGDATFDRH